MKKILFILVCLPSFLISLSCHSDDEVICDTQAIAGLNIVVRDATTNALLSEGVTVLAQDGTYLETLQLMPFDSQEVFVGAWERPGTYVITVSKEGYGTFTSDPILVTSDICHVIPVQMTVHLQAD